MTAFVPDEKCFVWHDENYFCEKSRLCRMVSIFQDRCCHPPLTELHWILYTRPLMNTVKQAAFLTGIVATYQLTVAAYKFMTSSMIQSVMIQQVKMLEKQDNNFILPWHLSNWTESAFFTFVVFLCWRLVSFSAFLKSVFFRRWVDCARARFVFDQLSSVKRSNPAKVT